LIPGRVGDFSLHHYIQTVSPNQWVLGVHFPWVKQAGQIADHSPLSLAKVKNAWDLHSSIYLQGMMLD